MKKHLIAAAVAAAVAVPAAAQVTIGGTIDASLHQSAKITTGVGGTPVPNNVSGTGNPFGTSGGWSTSELKFTGSEDLGGGLKALFNATQQLRSSGTGVIGDRVYTIGLSGGFGSVNLGRQSTVIEGMYGGFAVSGTTGGAGTTDSTGYDLVAGTLGIAQTATLASGTATAIGTGSMARQAGVLRYDSPKFNGLTISADYAKGTTDTGAAAGKDLASLYSAALNYSAGPLAVAIGIGRREVDDQVLTNFESNVNDKAEIRALGASYNFGPALIKYAYGAREDKDTSAVANLSDLTVHNVGITVPLGAVTLTASMYDGKDERGVGVNDDKDLTGNQLTARYTFSKRTFAYAVVGKSEMKVKGTGADGTRHTSSTFGMSHSF